MLITPARRLRGRKTQQRLGSIPPLRPLPVGVPLVAGEDYRSLMRRLARANHLPLPDLRDVLPEPAGTELISMAGLAALVGQPVERLAQLLDTRPRGWFGTDRRACQRCMARRGILDPVIVRTANYRPICRRHRRWLSHRPERPEDEFDLQAVPEILIAQRRHARLVIAHQHSLDVADTYGSAWHILHRWTERDDWSTHRLRRLGQFFDTARYRVYERHPLIALVNYPETVALARILADPRWVEQATGRGRPGLDRFHAEIRRRLRIDYEPYHGRDPLVAWREHTHRGRHHHPRPFEMVATIRGTDERGLTSAADDPAAGRRPPPHPRIAQLRWNRDALMSQRT